MNVDRGLRRYMRSRVWLRIIAIVWVAIMITYGVARVIAAVEPKAYLPSIFAISANNNSNSNQNGNDNGNQNGNDNGNQNDNDNGNQNGNDNQNDNGNDNDNQNGNGNGNAGDN